MEFIFSFVRVKKKQETPKDAFVLNEGHPPIDSEGNELYDVYIDPFLSRALRQYQKDGVKFM